MSATQAIFIQDQLEDRKRYDRAVVQLVPTLTSGTRVVAGKPGATSFGACDAVTFLGLNCFHVFQFESLIRQNI